MKKPWKPWYKKLSSWIEIVGSIAGILGISIFGGISIIGNNDRKDTFNQTTTESQTVIESTKIESEEDKPSDTYEPKSSVPEETIGNTKPKEVNESESFEDDLTEKKANAEPKQIFENHEPNDVSWNVSVTNWDNNYGIDGNKYPGGIRVDISNMFTSMGSGAGNDIVSRITYPINEEEKDPGGTIFKGMVILDQAMFGSSSHGTINIIANNEILFTTGDIGGNNTEAIPFDINCGDADSIIIETSATLISSNFTYGIVNQRE